MWHDFVVDFRFIVILNNICEFVIFGFFSWSLSTMCVLLVIIQIVELMSLLYIHRQRHSAWNSIVSNWKFVILVLFRLSFQPQRKDNWGLYTLSAIILVLWAFIFLFLWCDFGQKLTDQFELFEDEVYKCKWYLFSIEMQQIFAFAMMNVQQSIVVKGFGNIELSRETFEKVSKRVIIIQP